MCYIGQIKPLKIGTILVLKKWAGSLNARGSRTIRDLEERILLLRSINVITALAYSKYPS
jgi:hypothetical protein